MKFEEQAVLHLMNKLANRTDVWYKQLSSGGYAAQKPGAPAYKPVTVELMTQHLAGTITCGFPTLDDKGNCKWAAWDCDDDSDSLDRIEALAARLDIHLLREGRRPGRAGHSWMFLDKPVPAKALRTFNEWVCQQIRISVKSIEFFPKQAKAEIGSQVRVPLGINLKPEALRARGWFDGPEKDVQTQLAWFVNQPLNDSSKLFELVTEIEKHREPEFTIIRRSNRCSDFSIWDHVQKHHCRKVGSEYVTQCPVCTKAGHDKHKDNLHILADDSFLCMYSQPGKTHSRKQIIEALTGKAQYVPPTFKRQHSAPKVIEGKDHPA